MEKRVPYGEREVVLVEGGDRPLSAEEVRQACEARVIELVGETCRWSANGHGREWRPGDLRILIFETTVGVEAEMFVQFWSEPLEPVYWQVSSGRWPAQQEVDEGTRGKLRTLGFEIPDGRRNFQKKVTVANAGDAIAVGRETLRILCDALGYAGRTPLVARITRATRAHRQLAYRSFSPEDVQKILWHRGCRARRTEDRERPTLRVERRGLAYEAVLYSQIEGRDLYECVDLRAMLGRSAPPSLAAVNAINVGFRDVKAHVDSDGRAWLVQSIGTRGGITEAWFVSQCELFEWALGDRRVTRLMRRLDRQAAAQADDEAGKEQATEVVH